MLVKPVTREWLERKYIAEQLSCPQIARIVHRNPKRVYEWLRDLGIPTRRRGHDLASRKGWSNLDVSHRVGRTLSRRTRNKIRRKAIERGAVPYLKNGKHWLHVYGKSRHPRWRGGITPERQGFYASPEWRTAAGATWKRDKATCRRCRRKHRKGDPFDVHHVVSFECKSLRCDLSNLVLLCEPCHYWVHGPKNTRRRFLKPCL